jgi:hypothetical protein
MSLHSTIGIGPLFYDPRIWIGLVTVYSYNIKKIKG